MNDILQVLADVLFLNKCCVGVVILVVFVLVVLLGLWLVWCILVDQLQGMVDVDMLNVVVKIIVWLVELNVCEGDWVVVGQVLFVFDSFEVLVKEEQVYGVLDVVWVVVDKVDVGVCSEDICVV